MKFLWSTRMSLIVRSVDNKEDEDELAAYNEPLKRGQKFVVSYEGENGLINYETVVTDGKTKFTDLAKLVPSDGSSSAVTWLTLSGKPAVIAAGADAATARTAIGAGTSSVAVSTTAPAALASAAAVGTSASAARADHVHPFPTAAQIGAAATSHTHVGTAVTLTGYAIGTAGAVAATDNANAAIGKLEARIKALEDAAV